VITRATAFSFIKPFLCFDQQTTSAVEEHPGT
jgi:hypothetical protein